MHTMEKRIQAPLNGTSMLMYNNYTHCSNGVHLFPFYRGAQSPAPASHGTRPSGSASKTPLEQLTSDQAQSTGEIAVHQSTTVCVLFGLAKTIST